MLKYLFFLPISIFLMQCENDATEDCSATTCYAETVYIRLIDKNTNENLIANNTFSEGDINIVDQNENTISFELFSETDGTIAVIIASTTSETLNYTFQIGTEINFNTLIAVEKIGEGNYCCGIEKDIAQITVTGIDNEIVYETNTITIFVP